MEIKQETLFWGYLVRFTCVGCELKSNWMRPTRVMFQGWIGENPRLVETRKIWVRLHTPHCPAYYLEHYAPRN